MYIFTDEFDSSVEFYANDDLKAAIEAIKKRNHMGADMSRMAQEYCEADDADYCDWCEQMATSDFSRARGMLDMFNMICGTELTIPNIVCGKFQEMC